MLVLTLVVPDLAYHPGWSRFISIGSFLVLAGALQVVFALDAARRLYRNLRQRKFALAS
jgi:hypothetical protein